MEREGGIDGGVEVGAEGGDGQVEEGRGEEQQERMNMKLRS